MSDYGACPSCHSTSYANGTCVICGYRQAPQQQQQSGPLFFPGEVTFDLEEQGLEISSDVGRTRSTDLPSARSGDIFHTTCPRCGTEAGPDAPRRCTHCGYPMRLTRKKGGSGEDQRCRVCGVRNSTSSNTCQNCGSQFSD